MANAGIPHESTQGNVGTASRIYDIWETTAIIIRKKATAVDHQTRRVKGLWKM
jgi:hypothetical protein